MSEAFQLDVDGLILPRPIGGHPALDLCNTYAGWHDSAGGDYLTSYTQLVAWVGLVGLVDASRTSALHLAAQRDPIAAGRVLQQTIALRASLYAVLCDPDDATALAAVTTAIRRALRVGTLRPRGLAPREPLAWDVSGAGLAEPLHACALATGELLTGIPVSQVHACPGAGCGWVFHDPTGRRRWCRMEWCGNRMKQRAHAERTGPHGGDVTSRPAEPHGYSSPAAEAASHRLRPRGGAHEVARPRGWRPRGGAHEVALRADGSGGCGCRHRP